MSVLQPASRWDAFAELSVFREGYYACLSGRADAFLELSDGLLCAVTATQLRDVVERLVRAGHWRDGDRDVLAVADAGYDVTPLAWLLRDVPVELAGRLRSDRVLRRPAPTRAQFALANPSGGRYPKHGSELRMARPETRPEPTVTTVNDTPRYGKPETKAWDRIHPRLTHRSAWIDLNDELPVIEGTLIRLKVDRLPGDRDAPPVWLWSSAIGATPADVDFVGSCYLRRFDLEHTFSLFKQSLGWTRPRLRSPEAADRWTWLVIAAHTQLRLALPLTADQRKPWEKSTRPAPRSPRPASHAGSGTSAPTCLARPGRQNPPGPAQDGHQVRRTGIPSPATTWAKPSNAQQPLTERDQARC